MEKIKTVIQPPSRFSIGYKELWQYRELFYFFSWRDIKVKYKQTSLGILWVLLQPLILMLLFTFLFKSFKFHTGPMRYEIYVLSGLILWNFFNAAISNASDSIISQANIIRKIYFPRLIIPISSLLTAFFDFLIAFGLFLIFCLLYSEIPSLTALLFFPLSIIVLFLSAFGVAVFISALNVKFRDFRYIIPFLMQIFFFSSQIIYSSSNLKQGGLKYAIACNPLNSVIEIFRFPFTGKMDTSLVGIGIATALLFCIIGLYYFRKTEAYFADLA